MLKSMKNDRAGWNVVFKALIGEMREDDARFRSWMDSSDDNKKLYAQLTGKKRIKNTGYDKRKCWDNISDILGFGPQRRFSFLPFRRVRKLVACLVTVLSVSIGIGVWVRERPKVDDSLEISQTEKKDAFEPGTKKAYLQFSEGEIIDLGEPFKKENEDGTVISNDANGVVSFQKEERKNKKVVQQTIYVPKGGEYQLQLVDGTNVFLNSKTQLLFPGYFEGEKREVELLSGEAYFDVKKEAKPFVVKTRDMEIEVLGTTFNVNAYTDNTSTHTTLVRGKVRIRLPDKPIVYVLSPSDDFSMDRVLNRISVRKVDTRLYTAWVKGEFIFRNRRLDDIFVQLSRWYDCKIEYVNPAIKSMRFTGSAEKARTLDYLLNQIQAVTDVKYRREGEKIVLY